MLPPELGELVNLQNLWLQYTALSGEFSKIYMLYQLPNALIIIISKLSMEWSENI